MMGVLHSLVAFTRKRSMGKRAGALPSLVRALDDLVPRKVMREVVASSHDRRQWGVLAAAWVGVSEREFFEAAATCMGVPMEERLAPLDVTRFGERARALLGELRRIGAILITDERDILRIAAVDPAEVRGLSLYVPTIPVSLASWSDISRALDTSERMLIEYESNSAAREAQRRQEVSGKILKIIVREAAAHGASSVEVLTVDGKTRYQFVTSHGRTATGGIRAEVVQDLLRYLCSLEDGVFRSEDHGDIVLRSLGSVSNFRLSWGASLALRKEAGLDSGRRQEENASSLIPAGPRGGVSGAYLVDESAQDHPVLVVDDNPMFCRVLERLLRREEVIPIFADNGVRALEKLESAGTLLPRVIICDLHMPVMNGRELLTRLKSDERFKQIPIIMLTSDDDVDAELQLLASGADAFVSKGKDPRVLTAQVRRLLRRPSLEEAA
jgi:CheY-like chemotaxis protein